MDEHEKQRVTHIIILLSYTIFTLGLTGESILLGWDMGAVMLLLAGLVVSWALHITGKVSENIRQWVYVVLTMLAFFFYGVHKTSIFDLAPVMILIIIMYISAGMYSIINLCVAVYLFTMLYNFMFVSVFYKNLTYLIITRTLLHIVLVYMSGKLSKIIIRRRWQERKNADDIISALEETNRRTEDFLTNVSHELRTPINVVTGLTAVMLKNEEDEAKRNDILAVQMAGYRLFNQIEDILDYTEIDTGKIKVSEDSYMISSIVNDIISGNHMQKRENAPELIFDVDAKIPALLFGDGRKIKKIIKHLLDNSMKFTKKGGVYVRIYALPKQYGINLCIRVSDTGIGINEDNIAKIKERFYQLNGGRNRRAGGLGLGIPIVYGMVSAMEGFWQIESTEGNGTTVYVSIPHKVADASPCMSVDNRENLCLGCFLRPEKYAVPEVRSYYDEMITHMVQELELVLHRVFNFEELEKLLSMYKLTHLFIGREEYEENINYFEKLGKSIEIAVISDDGIVLPEGSNVKLIRKPFFCLPVVSMLNAGTDKNSNGIENECMICPKVRALVVDDEPMNLMVAEGILRDYKMQVKTAESGLKAIEICGREEFDLIFLDHMMPEMDGVETLKQLRRIHTGEGRTLTVIAFTANAVSGARDMFLKEGFDEFVSKPIEYMELERVLKKVLPKAYIEFVDKDWHGEGRYGQNTFTAEEKTEEQGMDVPAGENEEVKEAEDEFSLLEQIGINKSVGLQYCNGDKEFYSEILSQFAHDAVKKEKMIDEFWQKKDVTNYRIMVHALKSTSKMIGAASLSEMAGKAEEAAKKQDLSYIETHHEDLIAVYHKTAFEILDMQASENGSQNNGNLDKGMQICREEFLQRLSVLKGSFETFEAERAETLLAEMDNNIYQGVSVGELLRDIREDVEDFEFGKASEKLQALVDMVEGGGIHES